MIDKLSEYMDGKKTYVGLAIVAIAGLSGFDIDPGKLVGSDWVQLGAILGGTIFAAYGRKVAKPAKMARKAKRKTKKD